MQSRSLWATGNVCLRCQWRLLNQRQNIRQIHSRPALASIKAPQTSRRALHAAAKRLQLASVSTSTPPTFDPSLVPRPKDVEIREHLEQWQLQYGGPTQETLSAFENHPAHNDTQNGLSKLSSSFKSDQEDTNSSNQWSIAGQDEDDELITIGLFLKPGDVVELSQSGREPVLAVFVQQLDSVSQFYSVNGRWTHSALARVAFAIQGCIDPALLQPLIPFLPTDVEGAHPKGEIHVPGQVAAAVLEILESMTEEAESVYRENAAVLDTAYAVLADPHRTRIMTLTQITKMLLARNDPTWVPSPAALLAVRKALNHNEFRFRSDSRSHRLTNVFAIRPKSDVHTVETVHEWIREYREHLAQSRNKPRHAQEAPGQGVTYISEFLRKARRLIAHSRKRRDPIDGALGPSKTTSPPSESSPRLEITYGEPFSTTDRQIINFLQAWVLTNQFNNVAGLHAACASLIQATDCYDAGMIQPSGGNSAGNATRVSRGTGCLFLQEIGVLSPHENRYIYDEQLMLPTVRLSRNLELLNTKAELTRRNPDFKDSMAHVRRDWGSTTVFCIDDVGAHEIDDGISIERINGSDSEFWIHVHVANPTAFFDKTHTLSGLAAHMTETVYTPERAFPMLPAWAAQGYFSLDTNRPAITFSSRIDSVGKVLETKVHHGIVRKVLSITPSEVASLLGDHSALETNKFIVGGEVPQAKERPPPSISPDQLQDLRDLYTAAQALWDARKAAGGIRYGSASVNVRVFENANQAGLTWNPPSLDRSRLIQGDPIIEVTNTLPEGYMQFNIGPKNIVEEMMLLAGRTAAAWCSERNISVMYRGTVKPPSILGTSSEEMKEKMLSHAEQNRPIPRTLAMDYIRSLGRAVSHSAPIPHKIIGLSSYVKVTSPLRRFSDMIAHWQIEGAIRYEARTGKKFDATKISNPRGVLPFSQRQMQESIVTLSPRERIISATKKASQRFWLTLAFLRAFKYKEASLPDIFKCWVQIKYLNGEFEVHLPEYGVQAQMIEALDVQEGDEWEVALHQVNVFDLTIYVKPIRLVNREESA